MRKRKTLNNPTGYPYVLFKVIDKNSLAEILIVSATDKYAIKKAGFRKATVEPASITELIKENGHSKVAKYLSQISKKWICKEGRIFFP